jgi:Ser/Thr protein kinase RdoA (MazF antagonist)
MAAGIRAYVDRPVGDVAAAATAARVAARRWGLEDPELLRVGMNAIFGCGRCVLRVSAPSVPATASLELMAFLADEGVRVPIPARADVVVVGDLNVTCWERLEPVDAPIDWVSVGRMVQTVHGLDRAALPESVPLPSPTTFPWWDFPVLLDRVQPVLDDAARHGIESAIERHRDWTTDVGAVVCHGDVHPGNVVMTAGGATLIDWDLLCWAPPGWDHAAMLTWARRWGGNGDEYPAFAAGYGRSLADDPVAVAFAELRLVAATLMRLDAGMRDPSAMPEAQRRLAYWRGDPDAPPWTAQ